MTRPIPKVMNCEIRPRAGDPPLFTRHGDEIIPQLDGYLIIPLETWKEIVATLKKAREELGQI